MYVKLTLKRNHNGDTFTVTLKFAVNKRANKILENIITGVPPPTYLLITALLLFTVVPR